MNDTGKDVQSWDFAAVKGAIEAAGVALWSWHLDSDKFDMDRHGYRLWDIPPREPLTFEVLSAKIHPADLERVRAAFLTTRGFVGPFELDFRTLIGKEVRWISARGKGVEEDSVKRIMTGIFLNVTERKQAEESSELLAGEMSHRVKNLLTIASGLAQITSRSSSSVPDMTRQLTQRLAALGRAHDLVRPDHHAKAEAALLGDIISVLLTPYDDKDAFASRIRVAVPRIAVGETSATALALVVHELATNSLKYGALSSDDGFLNLSGHVTANTVRLIWTEEGGPEVADPGTDAGYGSKLVRNTVEGPLGGSIHYDWSKRGALITLEVDLDLLAD